MVTSTSHVGTYSIMLRATLGNNQSAYINYDVEIASPCKNVIVDVPEPTSSLVWDLSEINPLIVDLKWAVESPPENCEPDKFLFTIVNGTTNDILPPDTSIFTII